MDYSEEFRGGEGDRRVNPDGGCKYFGEWYVHLSHLCFLEDSSWCWNDFRVLRAKRDTG